MKFKKFVLLLLLIGLVLSDWFVIQFGINNQTYLMIPFFIYATINFKLTPNKILKLFFILYSLIIAIAGAYSNADQGVIFYRIFGNLLIAIIISNPRVMRGHFVAYTIFLFSIICLVVLVVPFYLNLYDFSAGRATLMGHNQNNLSHLLNAGLIAALFSVDKVVNKNTNKGKLSFIRKYSYLLFIPPIVATISRTGLLALAVTLITYLFLKKGKSIFKFIVYSLVLVLFSGLAIRTFSSRIFGIFIDRFQEASDDPRKDLAINAWKQVLEHPWLGVGFENFNSTSWRLAHNIVIVKPDQTDIMDASVHNGFIDLGLLGGIPLMLSFIFILSYYFFKSIKMLLSLDANIKSSGFFIFCAMQLTLLFVLTGQANLHKITWFYFGIIPPLMNYALTLSTYQKNNQLQNIPKLRGSNVEISHGSYFT